MCPKVDETGFYRSWSVFQSGVGSSVQQGAWGRMGRLMTPPGGLNPWGAMGMQKGMG